MADPMTPEEFPPVFYRLRHWADVAWRLFPPVGIVLDLCAFAAGAFAMLAKQQAKR